MMLSYAEITDHLCCMYQQETEKYLCLIDYMNIHISDDINCKGYDKWRRTMCKWSYDIVDHFGFDRDIVYVSLNYLDRYIAQRLQSQMAPHHLQKSHNRKWKTSLNFFGNRDVRLNTSSSSSLMNTNHEKRKVNASEFQLAGMTSLYIALKIHGQNEHEYDSQKHRCYTKEPTYPSGCMVLSALDFSRLSRGLYKEEDILEMERVLLHKLDWNLNPPTPVSFLIYYLHALDADFNNQVHHFAGSVHDNDTYSMRAKAMNKRIKFILYELGRYFLELAVSVYDLSVRQRPSSVALASLVMAMDAMNEDFLPNDLRARFHEGLTKVITPEHEKELQFVKVLIQDVCSEALSSSSQISSHISGMLGRVCEIKGNHCNFNVSPKSVMTSIKRFQ